MRRLVLLALLVALPGCFYPADRGRALEAKVDRLGADSAQMQTELKEARAQLAILLPKIDEKVAQVTKALDGLDTAARRKDADIGIQLQKTMEDLSQLRGQVETYLHKITELETALGAQDQKLLALQGTAAVKEAEAKKKAEELQRPTNPKDFLALAQERAKAGEVLVARQLFNELMKKWAKDPLVGEALFEYGKVVQDHPKTPSAPEAYLRSSECFAQLKMKDESRLALEELMKSYPKSGAAKTAKERIAELDKAKAPAKKGGKK